MINGLTLTVNLFCFLISISAFSNDNSDPKEWVEILYPEARKWKDFESLPIAKFGKDGIQKRILSDSYWKVNDRSADRTCDPIERIFAKPENHFRAFDINLDGKMDVIYSGPHPCAEGNLSITWIETSVGYASKDLYPQRRKILKINPGKAPEFVVVEIGCCDAAVDEYFKNGVNYRGPFIVFKNTMLPRNGLLQSKDINIKKEIVLRSSMALHEVYDKSSSEHLAMAVFGNVLGKYLPGANLKILAEDISNSGEKWSFVSMEGAESLRYYSVEKANIGWVLSSQISEDIKPK